MTDVETEKLKDKKYEYGKEENRTFFKIRIFVYAILLLNLIEYAILEIPKIHRQLIDLGIPKKVLPAVLLALMISKAAKTFFTHVFICIIILDIVSFINSNSYAYSLLYNLYMRIK